MAGIYYTLAGGMVGKYLTHKVNFFTMAFYGLAYQLFSGSIAIHFSSINERYALV
jgi:hypothetical protein